MLGNPGARDIKELISRLTGAGITLHGQIVLLRDMNDGSLLEETVEELLSYYPHLASLSVVPVGITRHRRNLPILQGYDQVSSRKVVSYVERKAKELRRNLGEDFLYGADEFYIQSGKRVPSGSRYGEFPQLENGVGIVRQFIDGGKAVSRMKGVDLSSISGVVATGRLAGKYVRDFIGKLNEKTGSSIYVLEVRNRLLGDTVSVTGLVPGRDIICDLSGKKAPFLFIPSVMLRESGDRFLDDVTPLMLQSNTGMIVKVFDPHPGDFFRMLRELSLKGLNSQE
jgi:NifB/MoaA-like Fe-S oxidoreductase